MLIKNRIRSFRNEAQGFFSEPELSCCKTTVWGPRRVSIVQQREVKRNPIVSGEKIQIGFTLNVVKESKTFQDSGKGKGG